MDLNITFECDKCGRDVEATVHFNNLRDRLEMTITPCDTCIAEAKEEAFDEGKEAGREEAAE